MASYETSRGKRFCPSTLKFNWDLEINISTLQQRLSNQTYYPGPYHPFMVYDSKKREILAPTFPDRVVHSALHRIIEPIFDPSFIFDSYACRKGKGTHRAIKRLQSFLKSAFMTNSRPSVASAERERERERERETNRSGKFTPLIKNFRSLDGGTNKLNIQIKNRPSLRAGVNGVYALQGDISRYFQNINHDILFNLIQKKIRDKFVLNLIKIIIDSHAPGLPIGNLTSQLFANIYLNELDKFVKHTLHLRYYLRYMDDFLILAYTKQEAWRLKTEIEQFLKYRLKLSLNSKRSTVTPVFKGLNFLGYVVFPDHCLLRPATVKRYTKKARARLRKFGERFLISPEFKKSWASWDGYAKFASSWHLRKKIIVNLKKYAQQLN
ncbi:MAG: reverse transcriptase/maturase family protein [Patescibacteria group bacterium]|nr:reverse transcriptase/maturase family protein [Patescibacteria group bacterium]